MVKREYFVLNFFTCYTAQSQKSLFIFFIEYTIKVFKKPLQTKIYPFQSVKEYIYEIAYINGSFSTFLSTIAA